MYAELHCRSYFSFLAGASSPEELVERAHALGYERICLTDVDGVYGLAQGYQAAKTLGVPLGVGAEVTVQNDLMPERSPEPLLSAVTPDPAHPPPGHRLVLLAQSADGYANLCKLLTLGRTRCEKGSSWVSWPEVQAHSGGLLALTGGPGGPVDAAWRRRELRTAFDWAMRLRETFDDRAFLELTHRLAPGDDERIRDLHQLAETSGLTPVITQDVRFATPAARRIYDVQTCIRDKTTLQTAGSRLAINAEAYLHSIAELRRRFAPRFKGALEASAQVARRLEFSLEELRYRFPECDLPPGETPFSYLHRLAYEGARSRYQPMTPRAASQLAHELALVEKLNLAGYFLIVWDIVRFCRERKILCQGRGSAANSAICYALGITAVDPVAMELLFERFLSEERDEMPDIDLDIDNGRREEVIQYVYRRFGRERVAMACNVNSYHARSAIRDVGKVFGLSLDQVDRAAKAMDRHVLDLSPQGQPTRAYDGVPDPANPTEDARVRIKALTGLDLGDPAVRQVFEIARAFEGMPRHLGIHSGGMVITAGPTWEVIPVENATMAQRTVVQWDKDDLNAMGIIKIDLLGLGMLSAIQSTLDLIERFEECTIDLARLPPGDQDVYDMICRADTVGTFQIESRAQMNMLPRLRPRNFYDLVIQVAIIRPGPIQGDMIHPYLRRRTGGEPVCFDHPSLAPVLKRTLGVPLFQEQGMKLAIACAGFTPSEADELRRAMGHKRSHARMAAIRDRLLIGMERNGIARDLAERIFSQLCAFADYGFPESHSASFALIVYASCYLKHHHPAAFLAGLLNAQPMGFYSPNSLIADARRHGVEVRPPCAVRSEWQTILETADGPPAVRLGMHQVRGLGDAYREHYEAERASAPYESIGDFARRSGLPRPALARLAAVGAFSRFEPDRRQALWKIAALPDPLGQLPLLDFACEEEDSQPARLRSMSPRERLTTSFDALGASVESHPMLFYRTALNRAQMLTADRLARARNGSRASVAGMVITRQRPGSAKGMMFMTVEDETGLANFVITPPIFERFRPIARSELFVIGSGVVERQGQVVNLKIQDLRPLPQSGEMPQVGSRNFR